MIETLKGSEIKLVLKHGQSFKTPHLIVIYRRNNLGFPRFAFIISRRFSKKAVVRNRVKRIIKEAIRLSNELLENLSYDIVLIPKKDIYTKKMTDILQDIQEIKRVLENNV
ncbi:ribonuclease P protein component [Persephonella sp. IF05-L8]|uniref:ribonuclease P protein component n=1 Tax=Persephonella sp. IF05-L8 TaxID=1158338 RepID=UPI00056720A1